MKKFLFLSQYFYPEPGATSELLSEVAVALKKSGYEVGAIAGQPSYHSKDRYPKVIDNQGVKICRVRSTRMNKDKSLGRILNTLSYSVLTLLNLLFKPRNVILVAVTNPPLLPWICLIASWLRRYRYVLVLHDLYPQIAVKLGALQADSLITKIWSRLNRLAYKGASRVIVLGRDMKQAVINDLPNAMVDKVHIIPNWADGASIYPIDREQHKLIRDLGIQDKFIIQYSGNIGRFHEIETILKAANLLKEEPFVFVFIGTGKQLPDVEKKAKELTNSRIILLPFQPRERLWESLTACDVGLVTLQQGLTGLAVPSKLYGILAAGKPVVVIGPNDCEAASVVKENKCGIVIPPGDARALANALRELSRDKQSGPTMGCNARRTFENNYDLPIVTQKWRDLFDNIELG